MRLKQSNRVSLSAFVLAALVVAMLTGGCSGSSTTSATDSDTQKAQSSSTAAQKEMTLDEYLQSGKEEWFLTGKKRYTVQAMMVSQEMSFHNELEVADYTVTDDGETVVLKGSVGEMWASKLSKVMETYTKPDGSALSEADFAEKDRYVDIVTIPTQDTNYAMFVPVDVSVIVESAWGDELHTNLPNAPHGAGDYLVCRVGADGEPDLSDVWVVNGMLFPECYEANSANESS